MLHFLQTMGVAVPEKGARFTDPAVTGLNISKIGYPRGRTP